MVSGEELVSSECTELSNARGSAAGGCRNVHNMRHEVTLANKCKNGEHTILDSSSGLPSGTKKGIITKGTNRRKDLSKMRWGKY